MQISQNSSVDTHFDLDFSSMPIPTRKKPDSAREKTENPDSARENLFHFQNNNWPFKSNVQTKLIWSKFSSAQISSAQIFNPLVSTHDAIWHVVFLHSLVKYRREVGTFGLGWLFAQC